MDFARIKRKRQLKLKGSAERPPKTKPATQSQDASVDGDNVPTGAVLLGKGKKAVGKGAGAAPDSAIIIMDSDDSEDERDGFQSSVFATPAASRQSASLQRQQCKYISSKTSIALNDDALRHACMVAHGCSTNLDLKGWQSFLHIQGMESFASSCLKIMSTIGQHPSLNDEVSDHLSPFALSYSTSLALSTLIRVSRVCVKLQFVNAFFAILSIRDTMQRKSTLNRKPR